MHKIARGYAYHLAKAGTIYHELSTIVDNSPELLKQLKCESHVRELGRLPDTESWVEILEIVEDGSDVTASRIREAVDAKLKAEPKPTRGMGSLSDTLR